MTALVMVAFIATIVLPMAAAKWISFAASMVVLMLSVSTFGLVVYAAIEAAKTALATAA